MIKKLSPILVDAMIVIGAHNGGFWDLLCNHYLVSIPATILEDELLYCGSKKNKKALLSSKWVKEGKAQRLEAHAQDHQMLRDKLSNDRMQSLDSGELEAIALLCTRGCKDYLFTTADQAAIKALAAIGLGHQGVSIETLLKRANAPNPILKALPSHFTKKKFDQYLLEGLIEKHLWVRKP